MTPFEEVLDTEFLRAGLLDSLGCEQVESVENAAASMVVAWPRLAELWPTSAPGREVVSLGLIGGVPPRPFIGMEYPPLLPAVRWCLLTQGVVTLEIHPIEAVVFLPATSEAYRNMSVSLLYGGGPPERGVVNERCRIEHLMREHIGSRFTDLLSLSTDAIPHIPGGWKSSYQLSWHLPTDSMSTTLMVTKAGGGTRENHRFDLSSRSTEHLTRLIELVSPLKSTKASRNVH